MEVVASIATTVGVVFAVLFGGRNVADAVRENSSNFFNTARRNRQIEHPSNGEVVQAYRQRVRQHHSRLRFGDPTTKVGEAVIEGVTTNSGIILTDVYTPLSVATEFSNSESNIRRPVQLRVLVQDALAQPEAHRSLVLGDPGAGKSTLVDYLTIKCVNDSSGKLPVHVRLSESSNIGSGSFWNAVPEVQCDGEIDCRLVNVLEAELQNSPSLMIFDGLDEVPAETLPSVLVSITRAEEQYPKAQIIVTCRPHDYYLTSPNRKLPKSFTKYRLLPFSLDDMLIYVDRWYAALAELEFVGNASERKRNLQDSLRNSDALEGLGSTPLLLALMGLVHATEGELPNSRSLLYHRAVEHLLSDSPQWRSDFSVETIRQDDIIGLAESVAFEAHSRESKQGGSFDGLTVEEIEAVAKKHVASVSGGRWDYARTRSAVDARVLRLVHGNGLLVEQVSGHYHFAHRSLQEFLAGLFFLQGNDYEDAIRLSSEPQWHEPFVLMAGYGGREGYALFFLTTFISELAGRQSDTSDVTTTMERLLLAGEMLSEIGQETLRANRYAQLVERGDNMNEPLWWKIIDQLFSAHSEQWSGIDSVRLLRVLGALGDPRFVNRDGSDVLLGTRLVRLPSITITIGDDSTNRPHAKSELVESIPLRTVFVNQLHVSKFMVTNYEYERFVTSRGYHEPRWWSDDGLRWLQGDPLFAEQLADRTMAWIHRDFDAELRIGKFRLEDVLRDAADMSQPRVEPFYWRNTRYNQPNQPVVGINWWEADAYCNWLTDSLREIGEISSRSTVRLPTDWEWERYARGVDDGRTFPWGEAQNDGSLAHTRFDGRDLDASIPVGALPSGCTEDGLFDVAGNAWEWTASRALPPGEEYDHERESVAGAVDLVVRGGSWFSDVVGAERCGYRGIDLPQNLYYDVGFRVVCSQEEE